jgi:hypothetical protein
MGVAVRFRASLRHFVDGGNGSAGASRQAQIGGVILGKPGQHDTTLYPSWWFVNYEGESL